jgi:hypothetical protein
VRGSRLAYDGDTSDSVLDLKRMISHIARFISASDFGLLLLLVLARVYPVLLHSWFASDLNASG